jgi:hypothetical protein
MRYMHRNIHRIGKRMKFRSRSSLVLNIRFYVCCRRVVRFLRLYHDLVKFSNTYTRKNAQVVTGRQVVFALLVPSCCNKFGTRC